MLLDLHLPGCISNCCGVQLLCIKHSSRRFKAATPRLIFHYLDKQNQTAGQQWTIEQKEHQTYFKKFKYIN